MWRAPPCSGLDSAPGIEQGLLSGCRAGSGGGPGWLPTGCWEPTEALRCSFACSQCVSLPTGWCASLCWCGAATLGRSHFPLPGVCLRSMPTLAGSSRSVIFPGPARRGWGTASLRLTAAVRVLSEASSDLRPGPARLASPCGFRNSSSQISFSPPAPFPLRRQGSIRRQWQILSQHSVLKGCPRVSRPRPTWHR